MLNDIFQKAFRNKGRLFYCFAGKFSSLQLFLLQSTALVLSSDCYNPTYVVAINTDHNYNAMFVANTEQKTLRFFIKVKV